MRYAVLDEIRGAGVVHTFLSFCWRGILHWPQSAKAALPQPELGLVGWPPVRLRWPRRWPGMESAFWLRLSEKVGNVNTAGEDRCDDSKKLSFTAKAPAGPDCGSQSGEPCKPLTLLTPDWKLASHCRFTQPFSVRGSLAEEKPVSGS